MANAKIIKFMFNSGCYLYFLSKPSVKFDSPIHVGFFILERAKAFMYDLYYNKLKAAYSGKINLLCSDTDSFLLKFTDQDLM